MWLLLLLVAGLATYHFVASRVDRQLRSVILRELVAAFPTYVVSLEHAQLREGSTLLLEGLRISEPTAEGLRDMVRLQRVIATGKLGLVDFLSRDIVVERVLVDGAELAIWPTSQGGWSWESLLASSSSAVRPPAFELRHGLLRLGKSSLASAGELVCHDLRVHHRQLGEGASAQWELEASMAGGQFDRLQLRLAIGDNGRQSRLSGEIIDLHYGPRLLSVLPEPLLEPLEHSQGSSGRIAAQFSAVPSDDGWQVQLRGALEQGRIQHPQLPYLMEDVQGKFFWSQGLLQVRQMTARSGELTTIELEADVSGTGPQAPLEARAKVRRLRLDQQLYESLPSLLQQEWDELRPSGEVDADVRLSFDGQRWEPELRVRPLQTSISADLFPVPIELLEGEVVYRDGRLEAQHYVARLGEQTLRGSARWDYADGRWFTDLEVSTDEPLRITEPLVAALTPRGEPTSRLEQVVRKLEPSGWLMVNRARFVRLPDQPEFLSKQLDVAFYRGSIRYAGFRYPIRDIHGELSIRDGRVELHNLHGLNRSSRFECTGSGQFDAVHGMEHLSLVIDAFNLHLDEDLQRALPDAARGWWDQLQPSGTVDRVTVRLEGGNDLPEPRLELELQTQPSGDGLHGRSVSLRAGWLPARLQAVACQMRYADEQLLVERFSADHEQSCVRAEGSCQREQDGSWSGSIRWLPGTRLVVDSALLSSLPANLREPLERLDFQGAVSPGGWTVFQLDSGNQQLRINRWDIRVEIEDGRLQGGGLASGIRGSMWLDGQANADGSIAIGYLALDALRVHDQPITAFRGPLAVRNHRLFLGTPVAQLPERLMGGAKGLQVRPCTAQALAGDLELSGVYDLGTGRMRLEANLQRANLRELLMDLGQSRPQADGLLSADLVLTGLPSSPHTLSGVGSLTLRSANLYRLPLLVQLFRLLSIRLPEERAFESADIQFRIDGDRIPLDKIALDGDVISLRGSGWTNFRRELYLDLYTYFGSRGTLAALLGPLVNQDNATLLRIEVEGMADNPSMRRSLPLPNNPFQDALLGANNK